MASEPAGDVELAEEQRLVEEAQQGNLDAMRPILERYASPLYGTVILPRLGDAASAEADRSAASAMTRRTRRGRDCRRREAGDRLTAFAGVRRDPALVLTDTRASCHRSRRRWLKRS